LIKKPLEWAEKQLNRFKNYMNQSRRSENRPKLH